MSKKNTRLVHEIGRRRRLACYRRHGSTHVWPSVPGTTLDTLMHILDPGIQKPVHTFLFEYITESSFRCTNRILPMTCEFQSAIPGGV